jgi:hypothetical protein
MTSTLPSRWQEILRREAAANVGTVLAQAREQPDPRRVPRWTVPSLVVGLASASLLSVMGRTEPRGRGSVPFDRSTVISTRSAGFGASAEDLAPRPVATAVLMPSPEATSPAPPQRQARPESRRADRGADRPPAACPDCDKRRAARQFIEATPIELEPEPAPSVPPSPPEKPLPLVINIGTRIEAVLSNPVITGAALAPATARLANDVYVGNRLAIPAGTVLVGEGFATQQDDRAQLVFTAMVRDGKTIQLEGWALEEGETGVHAKLVRKGSKAKKGAGTVLGAAASALSFGLGGAVSGPEGAALASLGNTAANDLFGLGRDWRRTDKVLRVEAGVSITVYIRRDVTLE